MKQCLICSYPCRSFRFSLRGTNTEIDCIRCGKYEITDEAVNDLKAQRFTEDQTANVSGYIRQNPGSTILSKDLERFRNLPTPSVGESGANLLTALSKEFPRPASEITIDWQRLITDLDLTAAVRAGNGEYPNDFFPDVSREASKWMGVASACSPGELRYLISDFLDKAQGSVVEKRPNVFVITPAGWQHITELKHTQSKSMTAFVAMYFAPELDDFFRDGMSRGIRAAGYDVLRIDRKEHNNQIDDEIIAGIRQTKFLVADFTGNRGGVYYEAGFAKGLGREVIWTVRKDDLKKVHFDTRQYNFIQWEDSDLPGFAKALQNRIEATIGKGPLTAA
jgi:hypothetical protein